MQRLHKWQIKLLDYHHRRNLISELMCLEVLDNPKAIDPKQLQWLELIMTVSKDKLEWVLHTDEVSEDKKQVILIWETHD